MNIRNIGTVFCTKCGRQRFNWYMPCVCEDTNIGTYNAVASEKEETEPTYKELEVKLAKLEQEVRLQKAELARVRRMANELQYEKKGWLNHYIPVSCFETRK